jgi:hypothetical protein
LSKLIPKFIHLKEKSNIPQLLIRGWNNWRFKNYGKDRRVCIVPAGVIMEPWCFIGHAFGHQGSKAQRNTKEVKPYIRKFQPYLEKAVCLPIW